MDIMDTLESLKNVVLPKELEEYIAKGWKIFPCKKDKKPLTSHGFLDATNEQDQIKLWYQKFTDCNWGLSVGDSDLSVIDIDIRNGGYFKENDDSFSIRNSSEKEFILPKTRFVKTGGGGYHLYYQGAKDLPKNLGEGIDFKSTGGYVILPPSIHQSGIPYKWGNELAITPFPEFLVLELDRQDHKTKREKFAPPEEIQEGKRNEILFKLACSLRSRVLTESEILATLETVNQARCKPPLKHDEISTIVSSAMKYEDSNVNYQGSYSTISGSGFANLDNSVTQVTQKSIWSIADLYDTEIPETKWAIPNIIPEGLTILGGRPKVGKSWLSLQMVHSIGTGGMFFGNRVEQGKCLYIALEDNLRRLQSRTKAQKIPKDAQIDFATKWNPLQGKGFEDLQRAIENDYKLIVIDTLSRAFPGVDQNDQVQIGMVMENLQMLCSQTNTTILFVDHIAKPKGITGVGDPIDDIMNSTVKTAVADQIMVLYKENGKLGARLKGRGRDIEEIDYSLSWDRENSCWQSEGNTYEVKLSKEREEILDCLIEKGAATVTAIAKALGKDISNTSKKLKELVNQGVVERRGEFYLYIGDTMPTNPTNPTNPTKATNTSSLEEWWNI